MKSKVVLPELSRPKNKILASFCHKPSDVSTPKNQSNKNIVFRTLGKTPGREGMLKPEDSVDLYRDKLWIVGNK